MTTPKLTDMLGAEIEDGDLVAYNPPNSSGLTIGRVESTTKAMVVITPKHGRGSMRLPHKRRGVEILRLGPEYHTALAMLLLKKK
jgi:hypothetical protein